MLRLTRLGFWSLVLVLAAAAGSRAADTPAEDPPAAKAAAPQVAEAKPESPAAAPPAERPAGRMPPEGGPRLTRGSMGPGSPLGGAPAKAPTDVLPARFEATVYEVQVPADRAGKIDAAALSAKAANADDLCKALAEFGPAKILYRVDQPVNVYSERIVISSVEPMVTNTRLSENGAKINTVQYQNVGLVIVLSGSQPPKDSGRKGPDVQMMIELAALGDSAAEVAAGVKVLAVRRVSIEHSEPFQYGRPLVMLNVTYPAKDEKGNAYACVIRYVFNEVKP